MKKSTQEHLPLAPLLHAYTRGEVPTLAQLHQLPGLGTRFGAILSASVKFLFPDFLDNAPAAELGDALSRFYEACVRPPLHAETLSRRAGLVRHALTYLLRGRDPWSLKAAACLSPAGTYYVAGLGPSFWSAVLQGLNPSRHPGWTPAILAGLSRLGLASWRRGDPPEVVYAALLSLYARIQALEPALSALHVDHFLTKIASLRGRNLPRDDELEHERGDGVVAAAIRAERGRLSLRQRLKDRGQALARGQEMLERALASCDGHGIGDALTAADPEGCQRAQIDWGAHGETLTLWVGRLWETDDPYGVLSRFWDEEPLSGGLWLPAAVLHLRDAQHFAPWNENVRAGYAALDEIAAENLPPVECYRLFNDGVQWLRRRHQLHPLEMPAILAACRVEQVPNDSRSAHEPRFHGFCADTFFFLGELVHNNKREWMERQRDRYRFAVREPLVELCRTLAERYVEPVLRGVHGWDLDTQPRSGRALTSICKNAYGRTEPYNTALWIAFCRRTERGGREDVQFFVRLDSEGLRYGLRLGRKARDAVRRFRQHVRQHAEPLFRILRDRGALSECRFGSTEDGEPVAIASPEDLRAWAERRSFEIACVRPADASLLTGDELAGDILLTFDRLLPLYACAVEEDGLSFLARCLGGALPGETYTDADFQRATLLGRDWLERTRGLLGLKRQLILQGVPGTGKTHVARHLARLLTGGRDDCMRLVQFHPAYGYEEFVEGIKVRSVTVDGRSDVTYPVEDGLLCSFAEQAARRPAEPHVLLIDEINRGNLPRIFGELLYLLEYREQSVCLPCSRRSFRLPANLYLLATMNAADRSVALIDQALRRRFSFLDMPPDAGVLSRWLHIHTPAAGAAFAERVLTLFDRLNTRLRSDLGPQAQVGHSYFMVPDLDEARLRIIWQHHIRPLLEEHFAAQPSRLAAYELDTLLDGGSHRAGRRRRVGAI